MVRFRPNRHPKCIAFAFRIVGDYELAKDIAQDVMLKIYVHIDQYDPTKKFFSWMYRILSNHCINHIRRDKAVRFIPFSSYGKDGFFIDTGHGSESPQPGEGSEYSSVLLQAAVEKLTSDHRNAFILCDVDEMPHDMVAQLLQVPVGTVRSRLFYARRKLRKTMSRYMTSELQ